MDQRIYLRKDTPYTILQTVPGSVDGDTVNVDVYNVTDDSSDTTSTAMTFVNGETWKYSFTPDDNDDYVATVHHPALDVKYYKYFKTIR